MLIYIAIGTFLATFSGGLLALIKKDKLHSILGFSAGAVMGVVFFDLLPEALDLGSKFYSTEVITTAVAIGFVLYLILDRSFSLHAHGHENCDHNGHGHEQSHPKNKRGLLGASSLSFHSLIDGIGIGLAFQASPSVGIIVAAAVLAHDFSDGLNTVAVILKNGHVDGGDQALNSRVRKTAFRFLLVDALAPVVGIIVTLFFTVPQNILSLLLAVFCGFFLYIGASELIPESHHAHPRFTTTIMTILGMLFLYTVIHFALI